MSKCSKALRASDPKNAVITIKIKYSISKPGSAEKAMSAKKVRRDQKLKPARHAENVWLTEKAKRYGKRTEKVGSIKKVRRDRRGAQTVRHPRKLGRVQKPRPQLVYRQRDEDYSDSDSDFFGL